MTESFASHPYTQQMELLCRTLPCIRHMPGTVPWNPLLLAKQWLTASGGERAAISFLISVWDSENGYIDSWREGWGFAPFMLSDFARLDETHQRAVAAWFAAPFWP